MRLFRILRLHKAVVWHSTATHESNDIRREWGESSRIILRGNHTLLPIEPDLPRKVPGTLPRFVYLGRIVEHKGLLIALEAMRSCDYPISLDVYGTREDETYFSECEKIIRELPEYVRVVFRGVVEPDEVRQTLANYDALLMPTAGENFSHVIAESLSVSCP